MAVFMTLNPNSRKATLKQKIFAWKTILDKASIIDNICTLQLPFQISTFHGSEVFLQVVGAVLFVFNASPGG